LSRGLVHFDPLKPSRPDAQEVSGDVLWRLRVHVSNRTLALQAPGSRLRVFNPVRFASRRNRTAAQNQA
ncbi:MAG: hypothetical protein EBZ50_15415, partial [Alphaproteobacteria bacterium]|nr:hypothetical protein [Alphaproteobacteria bacterium]